MEDKINLLKKITGSINQYFVSSSKFSFYYVLPFGLGLITALSIRDSYFLSYKQRLTMALASYYESTGEIINQDILNEFPKLEKIIERGKKYEQKQKDNEIKAQD